MNSQALQNYIIYITLVVLSLHRDHVIPLGEWPKTGWTWWAKDTCHMVKTVILNIFFMNGVVMSVMEGFTSFRYDFSSSASNTCASQRLSITEPSYSSASDQCTQSVMKDVELNSWNSVIFPCAALSRASILIVLSKSLQEGQHGPS